MNVCARMAAAMLWMVMMLGPRRRDSFLIAGEQESDKSFLGSSIMRIPVLTASTSGMGGL